MQLTGSEISKFIEAADHDRVRVASYDIGIGTVMVDGKEYERGEEFPDLEPQQMAIFVSEETVKMPSGHVGYALPKTSLCHEGVLALSTGMIDPGWHGRISTIAINFDSSSKSLSEGKGFLRVVVHKLSDEEGEEQEINIDERSYLADRRAESKSLPTGFLDLKSNVENILQSHARNQTNMFLVMLGAASVFVIVATTLLATFLQPVVSDYDSEINRLRDRVQTLEIRSAAQAREAPAQNPAVTETLPSQPREDQE